MFEIQFAKPTFSDIFCGPINKLFMLNIPYFWVFFLLIVLFEMKKKCVEISTMQSDISKGISITYFKKSLRFIGFFFFCYPLLPFDKSYDLGSLSSLNAIRTNPLIKIFSFLLKKKNNKILKYQCKIEISVFQRYSIFCFFLKIF